MPANRRLGFLLALTCNLAALPALAGDFSVSPTKVYLKATESVSTIKIKNLGDEPASVRLKPFVWGDSADPSALSDTDQVLIFPPIFNLGPDETQTVRLAHRDRGSVLAEETYRILISEVAKEVSDPGTIAMQLTINMPVFIAPEGVKARPEWALTSDGPKDPLVTLANQGDAHMQILSFALHQSGADDPIAEQATGGYIFAGETRSWPLDLDLAALKAPLTIKAETSVGPIEAVVRAPRD